MRLLAFKECARVGGVRVAERAPIDVPLATIRDEGLSSLETLELPRLLRVICGEPPRAASNEPGCEPMVFRTNGKGKSRQRTFGMLVYDSVSDLVGFLMEKFVPTGATELSRLVRRAHAGRGASARAELEDAVLGHSSARGRGARRYNDWPPRAPLPVMKRDHFEWYAQATFEQRREKFRLPSSDNPSFLRIFAAPLTLEVSGTQVPRLAFIVRLGEGQPTSGPRDEGPHVAFDGREHRWASDLQALGPTLVERLDKEGAVYQQADFDLLPREDLVARVVVRVPGRDELASLLGKPRKESAKPPHPGLATPGFVVDSRMPLRLSGDEPVILDPRTAIFLLSRVTKGIFVPGDAVRELPVKKLPETESWLVVASVA